MSGLVVGLALAVLASVALNGSYLLEHRGAASAPAITPRRPIASFLGLLASRAWLAGAALGTAGWAMHVTALTKAPLSLVQAFLAGGLVVIVPLAARLLHRPVQRSEIGAVALMTVALVGLTIGIGREGSQHHFTTGPLSAYLGVSFALTAALVLVRGERRSHALGLAGGVLYGAADVAIKGLTGIAADHGIGRVFVSPWLAVAIGLSIGAFFCFQRGLQTGRALPVIALMTAGTNVVSIIGGFAVFGDPLGTTFALSVLHLACFAVVAVAAWLLAPAQAALTVGQEDEDEDEPATRRETAPAGV
ncbi:MAG: hypothetical protein QOK31_413 [Solirubrobacteraceae bacterium]|nr:hypothetical protein [Solirubrobacteraceae bacterium]